MLLDEVHLDLSHVNGEHYVCVTAREGMEKEKRERLFDLARRVYGAGFRAEVLYNPDEALQVRIFLGAYGDLEPPRRGGATVDEDSTEVMGE